jgi:hypothetical protein
MENYGGATRRGMPHPLTLRHIEYTPWLLGWSRWEIVFEAGSRPGMVIRDVLASGRWRWRGRRAEYHEAVFGVDSVGSIDGPAFAGKSPGYYHPEPVA